MARIYDPAREAELTSVIAAREADIAERRERLAALQADTSDSGWTDGKGQHFMALVSEIDLLERDSFRAQSIVDDMLFHKPADAAPEGSYNDVLDRVIRRGANGITSEERESLASEIDSYGMMTLDPKPGSTDGIMISQGVSQAQFQHRRQVAGLGTLGRPLGDRRFAAVQSDGDSGSNFIDTETLPTVVDTLSQYGGALQVCGRLASSSTRPMRIPQENAATQKGVCLAAQNTAATESQTPNPSFVEFGMHTFHSGWVDITNEMIEDSGFDIVGWVLVQLQRRIGRIMNEKFTVGSGTNEPTGFMTDPTEHTVTGRDALSFPDDLTDLEYAVDEAYLIGEKGPHGLPMGPGMANRDGIIGFTFNRATEGHLRKAKDSDGRPLWRPDITGGAPDMINGWPYVTNNDIAKLATGAKTVAFGNLGNHKIRLQDAIGLWNFWDSGTATHNVRRLIGYSRADSNNIQAKIGSPAKWPGHASIVMA